MILLCILGTTAIVVAAGAIGRMLASTGCAYKAKILCSAVFISGRSPDEVLTADVGVEDLSVLRHFSWRLDRTTRTVTVSLWGLVRRTAASRGMAGCALQFPGVEDFGRLSIERHDTAHDLAPRSAARAHRLQSVGSPNTIDRSLLQEAIDEAFTEPPGFVCRRTRAIVVLHQGALLAERYSDGFGPETPLLGWSMAKTVINALAGILVGEGRLSLSSPLPQSLWCDESDPRRTITLDHLLRMTSGLDFYENYRSPFKDVIQMLLHSPDAAAYAAQKPLRHPPGSVWHYSSGNTNIIARVMRTVIESESDYLRFPRRALFDPLGMDSAVLEVDSSGTFVGSSFMYATARDWARFGSLYLQDGLSEGHRLLPKGWVEYSTRPTPQAPDGSYGAHVWLRVPKDFRPPEAVAPELPRAFHAVGHEGQFISVVPSRQLVVVRLGLTRRPRAWDHERFLSRILQAIPAAS